MIFEFKLDRRLERYQRLATKTTDFLYIDKRMKTLPIQNFSLNQYDTFKYLVFSSMNNACSGLQKDMDMDDSILLRTLQAA